MVNVRIYAKISSKKTNPLNSFKPIKGGSMRKTILFVFVLAFAVSNIFAGNLAGKVTAKTTGQALVGANVYLKGTSIGAATDEDGMYFIKADDGEYTVVCDYVSYSVEKAVVVISGDTKKDFQMTEYLFAKTIEVLADRAKERETPVAFSNVSKEKMEVTLGSRDIPMVLNTTPSVYATQGGGGAGDARINIRGFNQRNVAIMINGVPVNDMENGWVYWSNWDGVGDATASIQVQRGLSAVNLATASVGGTMNIITDPTAQNAGFMFKQEYGTGNFLKSSLFGSTGLIDGKYAFNAGVVRKIGEGQIDKTWTDAWAYYFGASWNINENNRMEAYAVGAPQRHGQNLYKQNAAAYSHDFAKSLDGYDEAALADFPEADADILYGDYSKADAEAGRLYNQTWGPVSSSYKGKQAVGTSTFDRHDPNFLNERENFYHKPQVNLNWYSNFTDNLGLATVLYFSGGQGGGTGTMGSMRYNYHVGIYDSPSRFVAWDATIARNDTNSTGSTGIIRNSRNNQYTWGAISKLNWKVNQNLRTSFGIDWRTAEIEHYREVRDLLGGDYYIPGSWDSSDFWTGTENQRKLGDKVGYNSTNTVDWIGGFAQAEYTLDKLTAYTTFGYATVKYSYVDHFRDDGTGNEFELDADRIAGFQIKGGALYRVLPTLEVYGNFGYVEKVPIFDAVIDDNNGVFSKDPENEKFTSFEAGVNWRGLNNTLNLKTGFYYTKWNDRSLPRSVETTPDNWDILFLTGVNQLHMGFEFEVAYQPMPMFRIDLAGSIAKWELTSDASGNLREEDSGGIITQTDYLVGVDGLMIGDAPQTQIALAGSVFPVKGLMAQLIYRYNAEFYADWDPTSRMVEGTEVPDREQVWKVPAFGIMDFHASYLLPFDVSGVSFKIFAHVFNALDSEYVQDATDNSQYNGFDGDHDADDAEIYMGLPRYFNVGVSINY